MSLVSLQDARDWLGIGTLDSSIDDARIQGLIAAADQLFESYVGVALVRRSYTQKFEGCDWEWVFDRRPVFAVTSIVDPAGNTIPASDYFLREEYGTLELLRWPRWAVRSDGTRDRWTVTYTAGLFAGEGDAPGSIKTGMQMMVAKWYYNPEPDVQSRREGDSATAYIPNPSSMHVVPPAVEALWSPWRSRVLS